MNNEMMMMKMAIQFNEPIAVLNFFFPFFNFSLFFVLKLLSKTYFKLFEYIFFLKLKKSCNKTDLQRACCKRIKQKKKNFQ